MADIEVRETDVEKPSEKQFESHSSLSQSDNGRIEAAQPQAEAETQPDGSKIEKLPSANDVSSIPNGGTVAWLQVLGSFFLFCNSWGLVNTFGVFQTIYDTELLSDVSPSSISWIGSIQSFLLLFVGALTGPIYDAGHFRALLIAGCFCTSFGMMMLSLCTELYQVILAQGILIGIGCGCLFVPSVAILSTYFTTHIGAAVGIAAAGSSIGGVVYPIMLHKLEPKVGFPWAVRIFGFIIFAGLLVPVFVMKMRVKPPAKRPLTDFKAFKYLPYTTFIIAAFFVFTGLYVPFFYSEIFAYQTHIGTGEFPFYTLAILNAASTFGRIAPSILGDVIVPFNVIIPCATITGILMLCLLAVHNVGGFVVFLILYGFFSGSFVSLPPAVMIGLSPNRALMGTHMGMAFAGIACGVLIGTPIAGQILKHYGYDAIWIFGGVFALFGTAIMFISRGLKLGRKNMISKV